MLWVRGTAVDTIDQNPCPQAVRLCLSCVLGTWARSLGREGALEKGMAAHSSGLAWRIPQTVEPGRL